MLSDQRHSLSFHLTAATLLLAGLATLIFAGYTGWVVGNIDDHAERREAILLQRAINDQMTKIGQDQEATTHWDDAVVQTKNGNQSWMKENLGEWMHSFYGHDQSIVLDASNRPIHAMIEGTTVDPSLLSEQMKVIAPLVRAMRAQLLTTDSRADLTQAGFILLYGEPMMVSIKAIVPDKDEILLQPGHEFLHVAMRRISQTYLTELGERYFIDHVRYNPPSAKKIEPSITLTGRNGKPAGWLTWVPDTPGRAIIQQTLPAIALMVSAMVAVLAIMTIKLRRMAARLIVSKAHATHLAFHDPLTGLANRALFSDRLAQAMARHDRTGEPFALHSIDLDGFKGVNDTLGHPCGDELIRQVGERLLGLIRECDTVARLGGDEFAILQSDCGSPRSAEVLAERILTEMGNPFDLAGERTTIGASIGIALIPGDATDGVDLIRKADMALYEAKGEGKARFCFFEAGLDKLVRHKRLIERDLKQALKTEKGLWLAFQPMFADDGTSVVGAEALARWNHPEQGQLPPSLFIPVAEERGLIGELSQWVLRETCRTLAEVDLDWIAVNFSALQFRDRALARKVLDCLAEFGVSPKRLQIEITESALIRDFESLKSILAELRAAGIRIVLDDFGTGYASLGYLHRYQFDKVKIDKVFIQRLTGTDNTSAVIRAVMELANAYHMKVTAEGVETETQWNELAAMGCRELQGFLFSRPLPADEFKLLCAKAHEQRNKPLSA